MDFTPAQYAIIEAIVEKAIAGRLPQPKVKPVKPKNFHTIPELRLLIATNIDAIRKEIGDVSFSLPVLSFVLKKHTKLRSEDEEWLEGSGERFDNQLSNAIRSEGWPNGCPFKPTGKRGIYCFIQSTQHSLFTQAQ